MGWPILKVGAKSIVAACVWIASTISRLSMPGIAAPQPSRAVQHLAIVVRVVEHALRPGQQPRIGSLERAIGAEGHPERIEVVRTADLVHGGGNPVCGDAAPWHCRCPISTRGVRMADGTLVIGTRRYSSWSLRGWLVVRLAGLDVEERIIPLAGPQQHASHQADHAGRHGPIPAAQGRRAVWEEPGSV